MDARRGRALLAAWLPVALYAAGIWVLSAGALPALGRDFPGRDKLLHGLEFGLLGVLAARAAVRTFAVASPPGNAAGASWRLAAIVALACAGWGFLDEVHQASVPSRTASVFDLLADVVGAALGSFVYVALRARRHLAATARGRDLR